MEKDMGVKILYAEKYRQYTKGQKIYNKGFWDGLLYGLFFYVLISFLLPPAVRWVQNTGIFGKVAPDVVPVNTKTLRIITLNRTDTFTA